MAQQPNVEITEAEAPRKTLAPGPANDWRATKPGVPQGPSDVPSGGKFGDAGPDPGWALKLVAHADLPGDDPRLAKVVAALTQARAAAFGRAAVPEDIQVALALCGYGTDAPPSVIERRARWLEATAHENRPGSTAVAEVDRELIMSSPGQVAFALKRPAPR